jgi:hypothetical protein
MDDLHNSSVWPVREGRFRGENLSVVGKKESVQEKHHERHGLAAYIVLAKAYTSISLVTEKIDGSHGGESSSGALNGQLEGTGQAALYMTLRKRASKSISHRHGIPASLIMILA